MTLQERLRPQALLVYADGHAEAYRSVHWPRRPAATGEVMVIVTGGRGTGMPQRAFCATKGKEGTVVVGGVTVPVYVESIAGEPAIDLDALEAHP